MILCLHVDTNDYEDQDDPGMRAENPWSLFNLSLETFQDWRVAGQTGFWTLDGVTYCGTSYECEINYRNELLLRCLVNKIKETLKYRYINLWIDDILVTFTDDGLMEMKLEWIKTMEN